MKIILIILSMMLSVTSFSVEETNNLNTNAPTVENVSVPNMANEQFIQVIGNMGEDSEDMEKLNEIGERVDAEVQKENPDWIKVEELYNELSIYTNKLAVNMMRALKEGGLDKNEPNFEEENVSSSTMNEKEIMEAIKKGMSDRELERMEYLSSKIATETERPKPDWDQVEKDYNELSKYTNRVTVIIMKVEKNRNGAQK